MRDQAKESVGVTAAVAVAFPSRLGLINVGGEGQLYMGAFMASGAAFLFSAAPAWLLLPTALSRPALQ